MRVYMQCFDRAAQRCICTCNHGTAMVLFTGGPGGLSRAAVGKFMTRARRRVKLIKFTVRALCPSSVGAAGANLSIVRASRILTYCQLTVEYGLYTKI